ncbi:hypothetical protein [Sphaerisporangium dianthi]|uniref:Uncharacterized protein n=1 Tax=Sphaerisporangium dianthi TaxID=1436120 RepID=A0ABV9CUY8_9ACTN
MRRSAIKSKLVPGGVTAVVVALLYLIVSGIMAGSDNPGAETSGPGPITVNDPGHRSLPQIPLR